MTVARLFPCPRCGRQTAREEPPGPSGVGYCWCSECGWEGDRPVREEERPSDALSAEPEAPGVTKSKVLIDRIAALAALPESPDLGLLERLLRDVGEETRGLDPLRREVIREQLRRSLEGKVPAPARFLDAAIQRQQGEAGSGDGGLQLEDPEPWPEPVDGGELLDALEHLLLRYLVLPEGAAPAIALWVAHAHALDTASVSPLLIISSPVKRCGKTTALRLLVPLVPRALPSSNITPAALFRSVEAFHPTLVVDEADSFVGVREDLRGILNSGHTRATAFVVRSVGKDHEPRRFSTWAPKVVALIGRLPSTLEDRGIRIAMRRKGRGETVERFRHDRLEDAVELARKAARWAEDHLHVLRQADPDVPSALHDREADNWRPLLAIANAAGGTWPEKARRAATLLSAAELAEDSSTGVQLLADLREDFRQRTRDRVPTEGLLRDLCGDETRPWGEWKAGQPLTPIQLSRLLKPFGIRPRKIRTGETVVQGYLLADFEDAFSRYLPSEPEHPEQLNEDGGLPSSSTRNTREDVPGCESPETPMETGVVPSVPGQQGKPRLGEAQTPQDREVFDV